MSAIRTIGSASTIKRIEVRPGELRLVLTLYTEEELRIQKKNCNSPF